MINIIDKIFIDFDGVIANTIATITNIYNYDFKYYDKYKYVNWIDVETWNFEELNATTPEYINTYFNQKRFFDNIILMDGALDMIKILSTKYDITVVSAGYSPNLKAKDEWLKYNMPFVNFIGVDLKKYKDKSHVNMENGIFIDDSASNLDTSNADIKICFGDKYVWNENWNGVRGYNWCDIKKLILG